MTAARPTTDNRQNDNRHITPVHIAAFAGLALVWLGYFGPWVTHQSGALSINGFDLAEWMTFLPEVRNGSLPANRITQLVPLAVAVIVTSALAWQMHGLARWLLSGLAAIGLLSLLPGYPFILFFREDTTVQRQLMLAGGTLAAALATLGLPRLPFKLGGWVLVTLIIAGMVIACRNFLALQPVVSALYGTSISAGYGLLFMQAGFLLTAAAELWRVRRRL